MPVIFKRYSDGNFPLTFLTCAASTRIDRGKDMKRRARERRGAEREIERSNS